MRVFEFDNYKEFLTAWIENRPKKGRGELQKISKHLNIHSTMVSHIVRGDKHLSLEHGCSLAEYLGLNDLETNYFLTLIQFDRAGSHLLRKRIQKNLEELKNKSQQIKNRLPSSAELKEEDKAIFYSHWLYSALRLTTTIPEHDDRRKLLESFNFPANVVNEMLDFLLAKGLCVEENEQIKIGPSKTHLSKESPLVWKHHQNWRIKAFDRHQKLEDEELFFTSPLTISKKDMAVVREKIVQLIEQVSSVVDETEPERLACLNIDWVKIN